MFQISVSGSRLRSVFGYPYPVANSLSCRGGTGSGLPVSTPDGFCVFLSDPEPDPDLKICERPDPDPESLFHFGSNRSLCGYFLG